MADFAEIIVPTEYKDANADLVARNSSLLATLLESADPSIETRRGAIASMVVLPAATFLGIAQQVSTLGQNCSSLSFLSKTTDPLYSGIIDETAANYRMTRKAGTAAFGTVRLIFTAGVSLSIGPATELSANGMTFRPVSIQALTAPEGGSLLGDAGHLRLLGDGSGRYYGDIYVEAVQTGSAGNLAKGTEFTIETTNLRYVQEAYALESFTGGSDSETDKSLVERMLTGISAKVLSSRTNMKASLLDAFPDIRDSSIIGAGDSEMTRDKHSVFPGSTGAYVDWYVGTSNQLQTVAAEVDQVYSVGTAEDGRFIYKVTVTNADIPCCIRVLSVTDTDTAEIFEIQKQERFGPSETRDDTPAMYDNAEASFTAFSEIEVTFYASRPISKVKVSGVCMPGIAEIQDWVQNCNLAPIGVDLLVKSAFPSKVRFSAVLNAPTGSAIDTVGLANIISNRINAVPFGGLLAVSALTTLLHLNLPSDSFITDAVMYAETYLPNGETAYSHANDKMNINIEPYVTNRTTLFYCDPADVQFEVRYTEGDRC